MSGFTREEALAHYGVKGMKWGVRKSASTTSKKPSYSIDKEGRITIEKGHQLQRVFQSGKAGTGETGTNFFSFTEKDNNIYRQMMGAGIDSKLGFIRKLASDKVSIMVAKEPLKSPSQKEAFEILKKTVDDVGPQKGLNGISAFKKDFTDKDALLWYQDANSKVVVKRDSPISKTFFENLRKEGYNLLLDELDSGFLSELPVIVLDGERSLRPQTISDLSSQDLKDAKAFLDTIKNEPIRTITDFAEGR